jgi:hypothetical protein
MSMKRMRLFFLCSLLFALCSLLPAVDFGLLLNQNAGYGGLGSDANFDYYVGLVPRLSGLIGKTGDFIISAGVEADYNKDGWGYIPELLRTELSFHPGNWAFEIGRMYHTDPLGFVAEGLFDGVRLAHHSEAGTFSLGAWYTGLLYKKRVNVELTPEEIEANKAPLDYNNWLGTYFAPKRFLGALSWEHLGLPVQPTISILGQFDFFGDNPVNSQYAVAKLVLPVKGFSLDVGGCFELIESNGGFSTALAAEAEIAYSPSTKLKNRLSLTGRYATGYTDEDSFFTAFQPLTTRSQGDVLRVRLTGLSIFSLDYVIRLHPAFSAGLTSTYFIRNDLGAYMGYPIPEENSDGHFLGDEFFVRLLWSPASDLQVNLGGGIFLPSLGNAAPNVENFWRVELNVVFSLF